MEDLIRLVDETELNAMVIDVKNDEGNLTFRLTNEEIPQDIPVLDRISEMQAGIRYIRDIQTMMQELKDHNIYTIARIVCFKDPILAAAQPELALTKPDGKPVTDANGLAWVNPYRQEVWEYLTELAEMAADLGFDEIQYDYVRFPVGSDADAADYGVDMEAYPKRQAIQDFLSYAGDRLHEKGCVVTADVFGTIIGSETDVQTVGQDYTALGQTVDAISPMVYPSHYANGVFGLKVPDAHPYETVSAAMQGSAEELQEIPEAERAVVRPWLQAFTATWVPGHISYNGTQIREQIQAVYDAGYEEWILWNATNRYSPDGLLAAGREAIAAEAGFITNPGRSTGQEPGLIGHKMKVVNKIMIGIAVLCLLLCGGILVFALNPDMTSSLAQKLYGNTVDMPPGTEETGEGQTSGNGNISVTLPNGMPGK